MNNQDLDKLLEFLKKDIKRVLDFIAPDESTLINKINIDGINEKGGLNEILNSLKANHPNYNEVLIYKYLPNGSTHGGKYQNYKLYNKFAVRVRFNRNTAVGSVVNKVESGAPTHSAPQATNYPTQPLDYSNPQGMNGMLGVQMKAFDYPRLERELAEKKEKIKEWEKKYDKLDEEHRIAKSQIATFELKSQLQEKLNKSSAVDILEKLAPVISQALPTVMNNQQTQAGLGGVQGLSEMKQAFVSMIADEAITDKQVENYYAFITKMQSDEIFRNEILAIVQKYN